MIRLSVLAVSALILCGSPLVGGQATITVGKNLHISRDTPTSMHGQTLAVANPNNPNELLACSHTIPDDGSRKDRSFVYLSRDAGKTWRDVTPAVDQESGTDPAVAFATDGALLFAYIAHPTATLTSVVMRSIDSGKSWSATRFDMVDRHFLAVDHGRSPYRGRIYITGRARIPNQRWGGFGLRYSKDGGKTFSDVVGISDPHDALTTAYSPGVVLSDGTFVALARQTPRENVFYGAWPTKRDGRVFAFTSKDGGETVTAAGVLTDRFADTAGLLASNDFMGLAVDQTDGPFRDRIYAVFPSYDPDTQRRDILTSYSTDKGATWSMPIAVNDDALPADLRNSPKHYMVAAAVNKQGVVGITWHDRRDSPNRLNFNVRFSASIDGGETYLPSVVVSEVPFDIDRVTLFPYPGTFGGGTSKKYDPLRRPDIAAMPRVFSWVSLVSSNFVGQHTAGLTADGDGVFHSFWINNRTNVPQLWSAPLTVNGRAARNGGGELETAEDVSTLMAVNYESAQYDRDSRMLTINAQLENVADVPFTGPFYLRVISTKPKLHPLGSPLLANQTGDYRIVNADNGDDGNGAFWRFQASRQDGMLQPGEKTPMRQLRFYVTVPPSHERAHQVGTYNGAYLHLIEFDGKVLASRPTRQSGR